MTLENDQIAALRELEARLREAAAKAESPTEAARFRMLLAEVQERLHESGHKPENS